MVHQVHLLFSNPWRTEGVDEYLFSSFIYPFSEVCIRLGSVCKKVTLKYILLVQNFFISQFAKSQNGWGWQGLLEVTCSSSLLKQGHLEQMAEGYVQEAFIFNPGDYFILCIVKIIIHHIHRVTSKHLHLLQLKLLLQKKKRSLKDSDEKWQ